MTIIFLPIFSFAANKNVGTSGAQFLKIGAGARTTAMGDAFVGIADDVNAVYFNPAGLTQLERPELTAMHTQWIQDISYDYGAFACPTKIGVFGLSATTLKVDDIPKRGADEGNIGDFEVMDAAYTLSYARTLFSNFSIGLTGRHMRQEIDNVLATTWGGDVGLFQKFERWPLSIGLAVKHFGQEVKFQEESDPQPLTVDAGVGSYLFRKKLTVGVDVKKPRDNDLQYGVGAEWKQRLIKEFRTAVRAGYNTSGTDADGASGIAMGAGLGFMSLQLDFAWVPFGDLGNTFRYAASFRF
ncbi:MAG: PorV/PorQ family protein [Elusimicrobia bacterium]|nr:PorV/PorQ family protein [Candidatus Obscuribacterium magneticum]MCB4755496.1 PorV/PorQ family protein [Candidatus Obscuribacterium magneticum]